MIGTGIRAPFDDPSKWGANLMSFFDRVLDFEPKTRATAKDALGHPFVKEAAPRDAISKMLISVFQGQALSFM